MAFLPPRPIIRVAWKAHRALFRWSGGRLGLQAARPDKEGLAQLTTTGRRSGRQRSVMIAYFDDGPDRVTMAMNGWDSADPAWWLNMQAEPTASLTTPEGTFSVIGRAAEGAEHDRLWNRWRELDKFVDQFSDRRKHGTPVVIMSPANS